jgi:hypothetical protein
MLRLRRSLPAAGGRFACIAPFSDLVSIGELIASAGQNRRLALRWQTEVEIWARSSHVAERRERGLLARGRPHGPYPGRTPARLLPTQCDARAVRDSDIQPGEPRMLERVASFSSPPRPEHGYKPGDPTPTRGGR